MAYPPWYIVYRKQQRTKGTKLKTKENITVNENGNAVVDGNEYSIRSFDYAGHEAITIPDLDLISYDDGDSWEEME